MHILFLTDNFPPEVNAPASRTFEHCCEWVKAGHQVTVITCAPNFPIGKVYDGYRNKLYQSEEIEGIHVIRVWSYITANSGFNRRILDYLSFMSSAILGSFLVRKADIVIGTSPQFFTACATYFVSRFKRIPFVFELRDIWPESIKAVGAMNDSTILKVLEEIELFLYNKADLIVTVTHSFKKNLSDRNISSDKIHVITNGVDSARFRPQPKDPELIGRYRLKDKFVAGYVGTHGMAHHLETLLETALLAQKNDDNFVFLFLGNGARKAALIKKAQDMALNNVIFIDSVRKSEVMRYWSVLDVSIIHLRNTPIFSSVIPSKLFECMAMGIPVVHGVRGESADIVRAGNVGITVEPENPTETYQSLVDLCAGADFYKKLKHNGLVYAKKFDRKALAFDMLELLKKQVQSSAKQPIKTFPVQ